MTEIKTIDDLIEYVEQRIHELNKYTWKNGIYYLSEISELANVLEVIRELKKNMEQAISRAEKDREFLIELSIPQWLEAEKIANRNIHYQDSTTQEYIDREIAKLVLKIRKHLEENP